GLKDYFEFPTKREALSDESINVSYSGCAILNDVDKVITNVHEPWYLVNPTGRGYRCQFIQMLSKGRKSMSRTFGSNIGNPNSVWSACNDSFTGDGSYELLNGNLDTSRIYGQLFPKNLSHRTQADSARGHHWMPVQQYFYDSNTKTDDFEKTWMFSPDYYSMGLAIEKIIPPNWATSFSIVRTLGAMKVQASGLVTYDIVSGHKNQSDTNKKQNSVLFYSSDLDTNNGLHSDLATEIENAPQNYQLVIESPLGFNSEVWTSNRRGGKDKQTDMLVVATMQRDDRNGSPVKPFLYLDDSIEPINDSNFRYVDFGRWRNLGVDSAAIYATGLASKKFNISNVEYVSGASTYAGDRGGHHWRITLNTTIYKNRYVSNQHHFKEANIKRWHEPWYQASIVNANNEPVQGRNASYVSTGHVQQIKSPFYLSKGVAFEQQLVDERWEDCIQDTVYDNNLTYTQGSRINGETVNYWQYRRFVYQDLGDGSPLRRWVHARFLTAQEIKDILLNANNFQPTDIDDGTGTGDTVQVWGIYNDSWDGQTYKNQKPSLVFDNQIIIDKAVSNPILQPVNQFNQRGYIPQAGSTIYIRYDDRIPIRVFGGDTFHAESTMVMADVKWTADGDPLDDDNTFQFNVGFPYGKYRFNERHIVVDKTYNAISYIQNQNKPKWADGTGSEPMLLRQMLALYISSSRTPKHTQYMKPASEDDINQFYPLVHYRQRPNRWDVDVAIGSQTNVKQEYYDDFGNEDNWWNYGGFRFMSTINQDYAAQNNFHEYVVKVIETIEEETEFCNRIIWSEPKPTNVVDSPNVRTFPALNFFDISDDTGEIKYAYDSDSDKGNNLYAITDSGVCLLLTNKRTLHEVAGQELATIGSEDLGVLKQIWIDKHIGMPDEHWRTAGESPIALYWANKDSVFRMIGTKIEDIGRKKYHTILNPKLRAIGDEFTTKLTGIYNKFHNEYWLNFDCPTGSYSSYAIGTVNAPDNDIAWIWDIDNNSGQALPDSTTGYIGHIGVDTSLDEAQFIIQSQNPPTLWLGGNTGDFLSANTSIKLCVAKGSQPFDVYEPIDQVTHTIEPETCKCFSNLGGSRGDTPESTIDWEVSVAMDTKFKGDYTPCNGWVRVKPYNSSGYLTGMQTAGWGTSGASTANTVINYTCNNCGVDGNATVNISSDGQEANVISDQGFLAVFKVDIYQRNSSGTLVLIQTYYTPPMGCVGQGS
ncbi:MAG: hypothetical protein ACXABY_12565, partial [Candidatus Thorarchaeota archaeon]